jgi:hypothetical protein
LWTLEETRKEMGKRKEKELTVGKGESPNYLALLLFLAGGLLSGLAVYGNMRRASYIIPLAAALVCAVVGSLLVARKSSAS